MLADWFTFSLIIRVTFAMLALLFVYGVAKLINSASNQLIWSDLISVPGVLGHDGGRPHADWNRIGQGFGVFLAVVIPLTYGFHPRMEWTGLLGLMSASLLYLASVTSYAARLRADAGKIETTHISEPADDPTVLKITDKKVEMPPIAPKGKKK